MNAEQAVRLSAAMRETFEEADIVGYKRHLLGLLNDQKDRHVVAAALEAEADLIVTSNLGDFVPVPEIVVVQSPDDFLMGLFRAKPGPLLRVLRLQAESYRNPPLSLVQVLDTLDLAAPGFVAIVRRRLAKDLPDDALNG